MHIFHSWQMMINTKLTLMCRNPIQTANIVEIELVQLCTQVSEIFENPTHQCKGSQVTASL